MKINEVLNFDTGRYIKQDGTERKFVYIVPELSEPIRKDTKVYNELKRLHGWFDKFRGVWTFNLEDSYNRYTKEELIDRIKEAITELVKIEQPENGVKRDDNIAVQIIDEILKKIESETFTTLDRKELEKGGVSEEESEVLKEKLENIKQKLIAGISDVEGLKAKLIEVFNQQKFSKHSTYSGQNTFLIFLQNPKATEVKAAGTWAKNYNREVIDFSHPIVMWMPISFTSKISLDQYNTLLDQYISDNNINPKKRNSREVKAAFKKYLLDQGILKTGTTFKLYKAYDISATKLINPNLGDPINDDNEEVNYEDEEFLDKLIAATEEFIKREGIREERVGNYGVLQKDVKGMSTGGSIYLNIDEKDKRKNFSTLIHELTHEFAHQTRFIRDNVEGEYQDESDFYVQNTTASYREQQAEVSAFTVLNFFHIDADEKNLVYLHSWQLTPENAGPIFDSVVKIVGYIIQNIHKIFYENDTNNATNENKQIREDNENMENNQESVADEIFNQPLPTAEEIANLVGKGKEYEAGKEMENESIEKIKKDFYENYQRIFGKKILW